ncbi:hypothetical protein KC363_g4566 [Hortaea werneckii]|nr:hypothetical protein KC356_g431 [Hortaea werneckii]KAI7190048.1 hypothetical protein KC363_g4566 [Hortaea werneckii]
MTTRNTNARPVSNLEEYLHGRYSAAQSLLDSNADEAGAMFLDLLHEPRLPLWRRVQCNYILASITDASGPAHSYLSDARLSLDLFMNSFLVGQEDDPEKKVTLQRDIEDMTKALDLVEAEIDEQLLTEDDDTMVEASSEIEESTAPSGTLSSDPIAAENPEAALTSDTTLPEPSSEAKTIEKEGREDTPHQGDINE